MKGIPHWNLLTKTFSADPSENSQNMQGLLLSVELESHSGVGSGEKAFALVAISRASTNFMATCSVDGLCCFSPVHESAS